MYTYMSSAIIILAYTQKWFKFANHALSREDLQNRKVGAIYSNVYNDLHTNIFDV